MMGLAEMSPSAGPCWRVAVVVCVGIPDPVVAELSEVWLSEGEWKCERRIWCGEEYQFWAKHPR